jgi:adenine-specific DNA-methyltransferase
VEGNKERYRLEWPGKREAIVTANLPTTKTLRIVFRNSSFVSYTAKENVKQLLKQLSAETEMRVI